MITVFIAFALLASAISANKVLLFAMSPTLLVGLRMLIAGIILFVYTYLSATHRLTWSSVKENMVTLVAVTISTTFLPSVLKAYGLKYMPSYKAAFFGTLDPFVTALYVYFLFGEKLTVQKIVGILIGFCGTLVLLVSSAPIEEQLKAFAFLSYPELAVLLAIAISRAGWIQIQQFVKKKVYAPTQINTLTMLMSGVISLTVAVVEGQTTIGTFENVSLPIIQQSLLSYIGSLGILSVFLAYTIIIGNVIAYNLYAHVLRYYSSTFIALAGFSIPLFVSFYGWLLLGEQLTINFFVSCFITFIGLMVFFLEEQKVIKND